MSLNQPVSLCPLFLPSDIVRMHADFQYYNASIVDKALGVTHQVLPTASALIKKLQKGTTYHHFLLLAHRQGYSSAQARELLGTLQLFGGLERYRQPQTWPIAVLTNIKQVLCGIFSIPLARRYRADAIGLLAAALSATKTLAFSGILTTYIIGEALSLPLSAQCDLFLFTYTLFLVSLIVHEYGHLLAIRAYGLPAVLLRQGMRIGILHAKLPPHKERLAALFGPLAGIGTCVLAAVFTTICKEPLYTAICFGIAVLHISGFLPWYSDGKSIFASQKGASNYDITTFTN